MGESLMPEHARALSLSISSSPSLSCLCGACLSSLTAWVFAWPNGQGYILANALSTGLGSPPPTPTPLLFLRTLLCSFSVLVVHMWLVTKVGPAERCLA